MMGVKRVIAKWAIKFLCEEEGHQWIEKGGRECPYSLCDCSQPVFQCGRCDEFDYGEVGGPGYESCERCDLRKEKVKNQ